MKREEAFAVVSEEMDYIEHIKSGAHPERARCDDETPMELAAIIRRCLHQIDETWYTLPGRERPERQAEFRKIAATAMRCIVKYGAPKRTHGIGSQCPWD